MTSTLDPNPSLLWGRIIISELVAAGITHVCVSPGSRSTPLTLAAASHAELRVHSHIDERSSAFFALGCAKMTGKPVALVCTSGSAAAHYLPALIEACHSRIPLVVLSADRPIELIHTGAGQTIDQRGMFAHHVVAAEHLETPSLLPQALRRLRGTIQRIVAKSIGQVGTNAAPGPVHLNVPFREPLAPLPDQTDAIARLTREHPELVHGREGAWIAHSLNTCHPTEAIMTRLVSACAKAQRGVIVCGPVEPTLHEGLADALSSLLAVASFPVMADPLSSLRYGLRHPYVVSTFDAILRARDAVAHEAYKPDLIIRLGAQPTSKSYRFWREAHPDVEEILIDPHGDVLDHPQLAGQVIYADPRQCLDILRKQLKRIGYLFSEGERSEREVWVQRWSRLQQRALAIMNDTLATTSSSLWEGQIARDVVEASSPEDILFLASSMPVRDVDALAHPRHDEPRQLIANRGANGIDGLIATAAGASSVTGKRCVLLIGDVAFLHDASSLLTALRGVDPRAPVRLDIIVINNAGGGIFAYLPIANFPEHFERHFITPHQADLSALCAAYGAHYTRVTAPELWRHTLAQKMPDTPGVTVTEVVVDRQQNVTIHRNMWSSIIEMVELAPHTA